MAKYVKSSFYDDFSRLSRIADSVKERYPKGTRIVLISMGDDPRPIPSGTRGTVDFVDDIATVFVNFDNGRHLGLAYGEDNYRKLTDEELAEEQAGGIKASRKMRAGSKGKYVKSGEVVDSDNIEDEYFRAYGKELDLNTVPCVIARDTFLSGWGKAEGQKAYQVVLCGNSFEMHNIEYRMNCVAKTESLANIRCSFGINPNRLKGTVSFKIGRYSRAWNDLSDSWYEEQNFSVDF